MTAQEPILIASDIHGNLTCTLKLLRQGIDPSNIYILGDVLNNGESEKEAEIIDLIRKGGINFLRGNHEDEFLEKYCGTSKALARKKRKIGISQKNRRFLRNSPTQYEFGKILLIHTPISPRRVKTIETAVEGFNVIGNRDICFHGHYHHPKAYSYNPRTGECREEKSGTFQLKDNIQYLINPGSLGINRTFLVYDPNKKTIRRYAF